MLSNKSQDNWLRRIIKLTWKFAVLKKVPTGLRLALLLASHSLTRGWATLRLIPDSAFSSCSSSLPASRPSSSSLIPLRAHTAAGASSAARGRERAATYLLAVRTCSKFRLRLKLKWLSTFQLFVNSSQVTWSPVSQTKKSQIRQQAVLV